MDLPDRYAEVLGDHVFEINTPENPTSFFADSSKISPDNDLYENVFALHDVKNQKIYIRKTAGRKALFLERGILDLLNSHQYIGEQRKAFFGFGSTLKYLQVWAFDLTESPENNPLSMHSKTRCPLNKTEQLKFAEARKKQIAEEKAQGTYVPRKRNKELMGLIKKNEYRFVLNLYTWHRYRLPTTQSFENVLRNEGSGLGGDTYQPPSKRGVGEAIGIIYKRDVLLGGEWWVMIDSRTIQEWEGVIRARNIRAGLEDKPVDFREDARFSHIETRYVDGKTLRLFVFDMNKGNEPPYTPRKARMTPNEKRAKRAMERMEWEERRRLLAEERAKRSEGEATSFGEFLQMNSHRKHCIGRTYGEYLYVIVKELKMHPKVNYRRAVLGYVGHKTVYFKPRLDTREQVSGTVYCAIFNLNVLRGKA